MQLCEVFKCPDNPVQLLQKKTAMMFVVFHKQLQAKLSWYDRRITTFVAVNPAIAKDIQVESAVIVYEHELEKYEPMCIRNVQDSKNPSITVSAKLARGNSQRDPR